MALPLSRALARFNSCGIFLVVTVILTYSEVEAIAWWVERIPPFRIGIGDTTLCIVGRNLKENLTEASQWIRLLIEADREMIACDVHSTWNTTLNISCRSRLPHPRSSDTWRQMITSFRPPKGVEDSAVKSLLLALWSDKAQKYDVYHQGNFVPPTNVNLKQEEFQLEQRNLESFSTKFNSYLPGENFYLRPAQTHIVVLQSENPIHIRASRGLTFAMVLSLQADTLDDRTIIQGIASLLNLPTDYLRITGISSEGKSRSPDSVDIEVQMEIHPSEPGDLNVTGIKNELIHSLQSCKLDKYVNASVYCIKMKPDEDLTNRKRASTGHRERWKRQSSEVKTYLKPFKLRLQRVPLSLAANESFEAELAITDQRGLVVEILEDSWIAQVKLVSWTPGASSKYLVGRNQTDFYYGVALFTNMTIAQPGSNYRLQFDAYDEDVGLTFPSLTTDLIQVRQRTLTLVPASKEPPYMAIENQELNPIPGVIIVDGLTGEPATPSTLEEFTWKAKIELKYDVYDGQLNGVTEIRVQKVNNILFRDLRITKWGYQYELLITVDSEPPSGRNMSLTIGPFDVLPDDEETRIYSDRSRQVTLFLDGEYSKVEEDERRFVVFFLNKLGVKYPKVKWLTAIPREGSITATSTISGIEENLEETVTNLDANVRNGMELEYIKSRPWRVKRAAISTPAPAMQKLPVESANTEGKKVEETALPLAWIAAIVINGVLVFLFIVFVIYCYCRSKKRHQANNGDIFEKRFDGDADRIYNEKAANHLPGMEKAVFISNSGDNPVFTVEDERRRFRDDDDEPDRYSTPIDGRRSTPMEYYDHQTSEDKPDVKEQGTITEEEYDDDLEDDYIQRSRGMIAGYQRQSSRSPTPPRDESPQGRIGTPFSYSDPTPEPQRYMTPEHAKSRTPKSRTPETLVRDEPTPEVRPQTVPVEEDRPATRETARAMSRDSMFDDDPMHLPGAITEILSPAPDPFGYPDEEWQTPRKTGSDSGHEEMPMVRYSVFVVSDPDGTRSQQGNVFIPDGAPVTLTHLRSYLSSAPDTAVQSVAANGDYTFLSPDLQDITLPEGALIVDRLYSDQEIYLRQVDNEWQAPKRKDADSAPSEPVGKTYSVYKLSNDDGTKEYLGSVTLPVEKPMTLTHLRGLLAEADLAVNGLKDKGYVFVSENDEDVSGPEGALLVDLLYPNQDIILRYNQTNVQAQEHKVPPPRRPRNQNQMAAVIRHDDSSKKKDYAYVGPLGMCNAPECEKPARIKCLTCGQVGYCSVRHMREDQPVHKRTCFNEGKPLEKPPWRN